MYRTIQHGLALTAVSLFFSTGAFAQQPVVVVNNANQPVPVAGLVYLQNPLLATPEPVQITLNLDFGATALAPKVSYTHPAGKRFVIEHMAARCSSLNANAQTFWLHLGVEQTTSLAWLDATTTSYALGGVFNGSIGANAKPLHAFSDAAFLWVEGERSAIGGATSCTVTILGYYTPRPQVLSK